MEVSAKDAHIDLDSIKAAERRNRSLVIDQDELRSILSNLSHELCRPLVSLRAGFDLLLGESPRRSPTTSAATC